MLSAEKIGVDLQVNLEVNSYLLGSLFRFPIPWARKIQKGITLRYAISALMLFSFNLTPPRITWGDSL